MGFLHEGHLSLIKRARQAIGKNGVVVVSIYVNPTQFGPTEDFSRYPRDLARDQKLCRWAGADLIFAPSDKEMYAGREEGKYSTYVVEETLSQVMEGSCRPTHFRGVTTVVSKLFNIVLPDVAVFGAKDFQQATIIQRMVKDLSFPIRIIVAPIVREPDGLAKSSRNKYLEGDLRRQAVVLSQAIQKAKEKVGRKKTETSVLVSELKEFIEQQPDARVDYIEVFDPETLQPSAQARPGLQIALAVFVGKTRLIDNAKL
jgi:pantoate--beta-alanine ligase